MAVSVEMINSERVVLMAPLAPNINHRETVFGGSASSLAILAAWSLVHFRLQAEGFACRVVIQRSSMRFDKPILGDFKAICSMPNNELWQKFIDILSRKNRSRINVVSHLECEGKRVGVLEGAFVAMNI